MTDAPAACPFCSMSIRLGERTERVSVPTDSGPDMETTAHADPCPDPDEE